MLNPSTRRRGRALLAGAAIVMLGGASCVPSTKVLVVAFNGGLLESSGDPVRTREQVGEELVAETLKDELADGYFYPRTAGDWAERIRAGGIDRLVLFVRERRDRTLRGAASSTSADRPCENVTVQRTLQIARDRDEEELIKELLDIADPSVKRLLEAAGDPCAAPGRPSELTLKLLDRNRFVQGLVRAGRRLADVYIEGLVDASTLLRGLDLGLRESADYLRNRRWARSVDRRVTGLVVKGGASTGFYSAGVAWVALNLIHHCLRDQECYRKSGDVRMVLLSGTSTGATVSAVADMFNTEWEPVLPDPKRFKAPEDGKFKSLKRLATWYTHLKSSDFYCIEKQPVTKILFDEQKGLVTFDGVRRLLEQHLNESTINNRSELILNAVDFRSGRLISASDQDPSMIKTPGDVAAAVEASFVLPVIATPVPRMLLHGKVVEGTFLDGGIRSEIPLLPLARRGAERALVISSGASILGGTKPLKNGLEIATRYIDVSTGGVAESELSHAQRLAESVRSHEIVACRDGSSGLTTLFARGAEPRGGHDGASRELAALCNGDWAGACPAPKKTGSVESSCSIEDARGGAGSGKAARPDIEALWQVKFFFRDDQRSDAAPGYDFDPGKTTPLFFAGMEAARVRCEELAGFLGIKLDPSVHRSTLRQWCSELPTYLPEEASKVIADWRECP